MKKLFLSLLLTTFCYNLLAQNTIIQYLSGTDKDHTSRWDFYCTGGRKSGHWSKIAVPSNWELQGFGNYNYGHDAVKTNEQGIYKYTFFLKKNNSKRVFIVFEGSMTDTKVMINGRLAGPVHQGGFYRFEYDITSLLAANGKNLLEVTVDKNSANASVNNAERSNSDFWVFGGIFRPVYLKIVPETFVERVAVNAKADGAFYMDVYLNGGETVEAQIQTTSGVNIGQPFTAKVSGPKAALSASVANPLLWSAEFPNLYQVVVRLRSGGRVVHQVKQRFGFRTIELRDALYVNGARVILKGSCRHSFWPETGRTLSYGIQLMDVQLMKQMNMNAVRMSHYPPDPAFLDVCDSLGLYVLDELTGWQANYDTVTGHKLVKELVVRDVNHPSVIFWDNGNEGGFNRGLDNDYALYDPQQRVVLHPWEKFNGTDTKHYPDYNYVQQSVASGQEVFFPTEFMHALYDGGAGAGLEDFWNLMLHHPHGAGGFIWAFLDESVIRTDKNGAYDSDGNHAPDGIVGPHREKEASFYTVKEIWSPVYLSLEDNFPIENRYSFTNLNQCTFKWQLLRFQGATAIVKASGTAVSPDLKPGQRSFLELNLPASWKQNDALYVTAYGPDKKEIFTWSRALQTPAFFIPTPLSGGPSSKTSETDRSLEITCDGITYTFDKTTGYLQNAGAVSLSGGPALAGVHTILEKFSHTENTVEAHYKDFHVKWTFTPGAKVKLDYQFTQPGDTDFTGITFNYPEEKITGMKWLGRGPYRVWKNRLAGQKFGVWHKNYNNAITGETFGYPEFKGYHAEVYWVVIENKEAPFTVYTENKHMYLQMLHPAREKAALDNNNVEPAFPEGSIGFLNAISPIGTKFQPARVMGPQGQKNHAGNEPVTGTLWFDFKH
jgi:hypothetical protein